MAVTGSVTVQFENRTVGTPTTLIAAPEATQRIRIVSLVASAPAAGAAVHLGDTGFASPGDPGWRWGVLAAAQTLPTALHYNPAGWWIGAAGKGLVANGPVVGSVTYEVVS